MVKRSVTLLEETIFQHVTIHKLMIYIYSKIKVCQDPFLAIIRSNILELKKIRGCNPVVLLESSKTIMKTLLTFTRLSCISPEVVGFIRRLMHDVYVRMRKLWEVYQIHGSYEVPKKRRGGCNLENLVGKENIEIKSHQLKKNDKIKNSKKKISETLSKNESLLNQDKNETKMKESGKCEADIASQIRDTVVNELAGSFSKTSLFERIKTIITENQEKSGDEICMEVKDPESVIEQKDFKSPKKRKIKNRKWSMGIIQAKKKKKVDYNNKVDTKSEMNTTKVTDDIADASEELKNKSEVYKKEISQPKDFEDDESSLNKCNIITKDSGWEERLRVQREYYLNEMSKVAYRLNTKISPLPNYDFINELTAKMDISLTTYGHAVKELMAMDHAQLIESNNEINKSSSRHLDLWKIEPNINSTYVGIFKATRYRKRFIYECTGENCSIKTIHLSVLYNHAVSTHKPFKWDWSCSMCGTVQQINLLQNANLLDMTMYHLVAYHSTPALNRNPEFPSFEAQTQSKMKIESALNKPNKACVTSNGSAKAYCSQLYKCSKCSFSSGLFSEALNHFSFEYKENEELKCIYCSKFESSAYSLCDHMELYHSSSIFLCSECHYRSISPCNTLNHYYDEHDDGDENKEILIYVNVEPVGSKVYSPPTLFPSSELKKYVCSHPEGEEFSTMIGSKFVSHLTTCPTQGGKRGNGSNKKFECSLCGTKIGAAYKLRQHFESHQLLRYICVYCGQGSTKLPFLHEHLYKIHMFWHPRYIIREAYDDCPKEISLEYSSIMKYETELEDLIEVSIEMEEFQTQNSRVKLRMISGDPWPGNIFSDKFQEINSDTPLSNSKKEDSCETKSELQQNCVSEGKIDSFETLVEERHDPDNGQNGTLDQQQKEVNITLMQQKQDVNIIDLTEDEAHSDVQKESDKKLTLVNDISEIIEIPSDSEEKEGSLADQQKLIKPPGKNNSNNNSLLNSTITVTKETFAENPLRQFRFSRNTTASATIGYIISSPRTSTATTSSNDRIKISPFSSGSSPLLNSDWKKINEALGNIFTNSPSTASGSNAKTSLIITSTPSPSSRLPSCSPGVVTPQVTPESTHPVGVENRTPEIRVIAEAKLDNFRNSLLLENNPQQPNPIDKSDVFSDNLEPTYGIDRGPFSASLTVPNIFSPKKVDPKSKTIQVVRICKENKPSEGIIFFKCPYCNYAGHDKSGLSQHIARMHTDIVNSSSLQVAKDFKCAKCQTSFEGFALLHKHMETNHDEDTIGVFQIFVEGNVFVRKDIKICFLCSALIVSLEQLYKHPDVCPFAHTTGTHLNSSIVYATGNQYKAIFVYQKSEIKVNRNIVELLQPHLPSTTAEQQNVVKRAVAKKSTGPRPQVQETVISTQVANFRRAVARKSTGPYVLPPPNYRN